LAVILPLTETVEIAENKKYSPAVVAGRLAAPSGITHVAVVHCETTTGILNSIEEIGEVVHGAGASYVVDAMSSFGAIPVDLSADHIDFLISSANKCIEGVPGFGFVLARHSRLEESKGNARTLSLDLYAQWAGLQGDGQFRFTPPTHALLAFHQALDELDAEGAHKAGRRDTLRTTGSSCAALPHSDWKLISCPKTRVASSRHFFTHPILGLTLSVSTGR